MNILVEYKNADGHINKQYHSFTRIAFAKHLAIAGQGYAPKLQKLIRTIAMFFHYGYYLKKEAFDKGKFSEPPIAFYDPTEKGQFSNLAGKAIADILSKRIDKSIFTINYEAAMKLKGMPINVQRPDLLAYKTNAVFAIEAKGYSRGAGKMEKHKRQSQEGGIPVNFSVACVSYNLYENIRCKYYDPYNENIPYDKELFQKLTQQYYSGLSEFLDENCSSNTELIEVQGEKFYEIDLVDILFKNSFNDFPFRYSGCLEILKYYRPSLILPIAIKDYAKTGIVDQVQPFIFVTNDEQEKKLYIDNDRIGLRVRR